MAILHILFSLLHFKIVVCVVVLSECMSVHLVHVWCHWMLKEDVGAPETKVKGCGWLLCGYWELSLGPVKATSALWPQLPPASYLSFLLSSHSSFIPSFCTFTHTHVYIHNWKRSISVIF